jgi:hypothetical protein
MNEASSQPEISEEAAFENAYYYFVQAVEVLAMAAEAQCEIMGNYNVAWELKGDVSAGSYLFNLPCPKVTDQQKRSILALIASLDELPNPVLQAGVGAVPSLASMRHPCWVPLRKQAQELLAILSPLTINNAQYFESQRSES